ncbi:uncharacterized protein LOC133188597 [Saccostrea echinata]|uniref:uncharacterized protein LOC133188597 n=1 Tax=Saccostrea echinata TaxID=191078 RepID=UPI002A824F9C|nr:uncharacterized protein LOC133188597 [Saccostrea echinata]
MASSEEDSLSSHGTDTGSSSSFQWSKYGKKFPGRASHWRLEHLLELSVFYDEKATDLGKFMSDLKTLKSVARGGLLEMPRISHTIMQYTKELWNFSYDFYKETGEEKWEARDQIERATEAFDDKENDMEEQVKSFGGNWKRLFFGWKINLFEFWRHFSMLLARLGQATPREGRFTHLFMAFSQIFFLSPEPGEAFIERIVIRDLVVRGIPGVRFNTFQDKLLKVFIVTEVKLYDALEGNFNSETFTFRNVGKKVLGQHGIELLMERKGSFFFPYVVGILCIGTQVILTYLRIDEDHFHQIEEKGEVNKTSNATISYTRPFDFMDTSDRQEILESFFWLGYVQSNAYQFKWK